MRFLTGADVVLPDRLLSSGTVVLDGDRVVDVLPGAAKGSGRDTHHDLRDRLVVPGFIDVHVHGIEGVDALDGGNAISQIAARLPRYGVTAFCPTSIACSPAALRTMLAAVRAARVTPAGGSARVLPAHLESNFINPEYRGAQPIECLRLPRGAGEGRSDGEFTGLDILAEIDAARPDVGIVTVAPELDGIIDLIRDLSARGHRVSLGHSGASYDQGLDAIRAGARHATHLFNRMTPIAHRAPGLAGAILEHEDVSAEIICDGIHVHPSMVRVALAAKSPSRVMAITDGTAGSGLARGSRASLGGRTIIVGDAACLDDGTLAGSVLTMDRVFAVLVTAVGLSFVDAATVCATSPARALNLQACGVIAPGGAADLTVLSRDLAVVQTWIAGELAFSQL